MSARQLIVLGVALLAAIGALFIVNGLGRNSEPAAEIEEIAGEDVLVAARDILQGAPLSPTDLEWRRFPEASVGPSFIRSSGQASAQADYVGAIARRAFVEGEPITQGSLIQPDGGGAMAAILPPGYRAIAVEVDSATGAGGYIQPNDHVDVIVTAKLDVTDQSGGSREEVRSDVVLENVRVMALDDAVQASNSPEGPTRASYDIAVLELTAADARTLAMANELGDISLALRGVETEPPGYAAPSAARGSSVLDQNARGDSVRIHAFGAVQGGR